jgi:hypothetical protein
MNFELILPFLRPIEPLLLDESISEILGNPDASWWYERDGIMLREPFNFVAVQERCFAPEEFRHSIPGRVACGTRRALFPKRTERSGVARSA